MENKTLEHLIRIQLKHKEQNVTPLVLDYLTHLNNVINNPLIHTNYEAIALYKVNKDLLIKNGYRVELRE